MNGAEEAFWQWRAAISPYFDSVPLVDPRRSAAPPPTCVQYTLGDTLLIDTTFPRQVFLRDARWRRQHDDADHLLVQVFLRGGNIVCCGDTEYIERPGGVFAVNLGYETTGVSTDAEVLTLVLPRPWLASAAEGLVDVRGHLFTPDGSAERLLADYMVSLRREAATARRESAPAMAE
ncbi:MAG: hypothetical protein HQL40_08195, partial [Alphaproteobacteria bacterium]|nr:hypothetical protein [Alphaproteobacteria bacterium]